MGDRVNNILIVNGPKLQQKIFILKLIYYLLITFSSKIKFRIFHLKETKIYKSLPNTKQNRLSDLAKLSFDIKIVIRRTRVQNFKRKMLSSLLSRGSRNFYFVWHFNHAKFILTQWDCKMFYMSFRFIFIPDRIWWKYP